MKKIVIFTYFFISFSFVLKSQEYSHEPTQTYSYGLHPELGGFVFQLSEDKLHGLVAETKDLGSLNWYDATNNLNSENMKVLYSSYAAKFSDWRLPTMHELYLMIEQSLSIGGFRYGSGRDSDDCCAYWTSIEEDADRAMVKYIRPIHTETAAWKRYANFVRPVRSF